MEVRQPLISMTTERATFLHAPTNFSRPPSFLIKSGLSRTGIRPTTDRYPCLDGKEGKEARSKGPDNPHWSSDWFYCYFPYLCTHH